ncbi:hypothetical protein ACRRTK_013443 [Alexandromys fortis]
MASHKASAKPALAPSYRWDPAAWWRRAREEEEEQRQWEPEPEQEQDEPHKLTATAAARAQARSRSPRPGPLPASRLPWPPAGRPAPSAPPGPELPPSLLHPGRGEEEAEQEASRSRRRQRRRRRPSRTERAAAPRVRPPPAPIQQPRRSHTAGQLGLRRAPAQPGPAQPSPSTGRPGGRPAPEGAGRGERMPKPTLLLRGGWERERSPGDSELGRQFRDWCLRTYGDSAKTKTVTRSKYQRIAEVLQGGGGTGAGSGPAAGEKGKFQFWVRSKGFRLGSGREPKMGQVVYVPVKTGSGTGLQAAGSGSRERGGRAAHLRGALITAPLPLRPPAAHLRRCRLRPDREQGAGPRGAPTGFPEREIGPRPCGAGHRDPPAQTDTRLQTQGVWVIVPLLRWANDDLPQPNHCPFALMGQPASHLQALAVLLGKQSTDAKPGQPRKGTVVLEDGG